MNKAIRILIAPMYMYHVIQTNRYSRLYTAACINMDAWDKRLIRFGNKREYHVKEMQKMENKYLT